MSEKNIYPTLTLYGFGDGWYRGVDIRGGKCVGPKVEICLDICILVTGDDRPGNIGGGVL